jgi:hypothetical protein
MYDKKWIECPKCGKNNEWEPTKTTYPEKGGYFTEKNFATCSCGHKQLIYEMRKHKDQSITKEKHHENFPE